MNGLPYTAFRGPNLHGIYPNQHAAKMKRPGPAHSTEFCAWANLVQPQPLSVLCKMPDQPDQTYISASTADTERLAAAVARQISGGDIISLEGDLGAGKTFFTRALAATLGISQPITSPTFVLQKLYPVSDHPTIRSIAHYDFYRIADYMELVDMGFEAHDNDTLVIAEWGDMFISEFPSRAVRIKFIAQSNDSRLITVSGLSLPKQLT